MRAPRISVVTPTYNRAHTLPALRDSLLGQRFTDFEWLVVDDGSTDDTQALLGVWSGENRLRVRTIARLNGGKHRALNDGIREARGEWIFIVDSDDTLPADSLEKLNRWAIEADSEPRACGLMGLKAYSGGGAIGESLPTQLRYADALELTYRYGIRGDKAEAYKAAVLKQFPFPEFEGERFLTEAVVWYRMARAGWTLRLCPEVLYESTYHPDGLSAQSLRLRIRNPRGTLLFYREEVEGDLPFAGALREAANYLRFSLHARDAVPQAERGLAALSPRARKLALPAAPLGYLAWLRDIKALRASSREGF